jgi:hypothetical protein
MFLRETQLGARAHALHNTFSYLVTLWGDFQRGVGSTAQALIRYTWPALGQQCILWWKEWLRLVLELFASTVYYSTTSLVS